MKKQHGRLARPDNKGGTLYSGARYVALWAPCYQIHSVIFLHHVHSAVYVIVH